jgi:aubergine-like protein
MMVGFDVYHCSGGKGASVGALVASTNVSFGSYYSTTSIHHNRDELASNLCSSFRRALKAYRFKNEGNLPARIFLFRDGVGAGQLGFVYNIELPQIQDAIKAEYGDPSLVKFTMIIVTKRIDTRLFLAPDKAGGRFANPLPGTVVDDVITLPERHDFYLISQTTRNGTVSPTAYHVIFNQQEFPPGLLQMLAFKMCHLYFNCSTSVAVPAPCQYAHKLAYLAGVNLQGVVPEHLAHLLYYL